jgi:hypothetical protein
MRVEDDFDKAVKTGTVITLNELARTLVSALIAEICFILLPFKAGQSVLLKQSGFKKGRLCLDNVFTFK